MSAELTFTLTVSTTERSSLQYFCQLRIYECEDNLRAIKPASTGADVSKEAAECREYWTKQLTEAKNLFERLVMLGVSSCEEVTDA